MTEKVYKDEKRCQIVNEELGRLGQYIIYFFNKLPIRSKVIKSAIRQYKKDDKFCYFGTWYLRGPKFKLNFDDPYDHELETDFEFFKKNMTLSNFLKKHSGNFELKRKIMFTCCYCYDYASVHFVSFIYDSKRRKLTHFDPGVHLYPKGQEVLVPSVVKAFKLAKLIEKNKYGKPNDELGDDCPRYQYILKQEPIGIQYNGNNRDAFCQSWTLFFLVDQIKHFDESVENLCRIIPENRELHLYEHFIIPFLKKKGNYPKYLNEIIQDLKDEDVKVKSPKQYLKLLEDYINVCYVTDSKQQKQGQLIDKHKNQKKKLQEKYKKDKKELEKKHRQEKKHLQNQSKEKKLEKQFLKEKQELKQKYQEEKQKIQQQKSNKN